MENSHPKPPLRDRIIPWYFVMGFMVVFAVNGVFVYVATSTYRGVVTEHSYKKGVNYNATIARAEAQSSLGWKGVFTLKNNRLIYTLTDKDGAVISAADITAHINRPIQDGYEFSVPLAENETGNYSATIDFPMKGQWDITVISKWKQQQHQMHKRIIIK